MIAMDSTTVHEQVTKMHKETFKSTNGYFIVKTENYKQELRETVASFLREYDSQRNNCISLSSDHDSFC